MDISREVFQGIDEIRCGILVSLVTITDESMNDLLSKDEIIVAFKLLGQHAAREGMTVELFVVGGVAIIFGHPMAEEMRGGLTHDVDVVFVQPQDARLSKLRGIIGVIGTELNLPAG